MKANGRKQASNRDASRSIVRDLPSAFGRIAALAVASLSGESLARYYAYKQALIELDQDNQSVISTLSIFVWDLFEGRSSLDLH